MPIDASVRRKWIEAGVLIGMFLVAAALILPAIQQSREAARRTQSKNNLRQLGLAFDNYIDTSRVMPPGGIFNTAGTPFIGWPVSIMPFLDVTPLYNRINFSFPWDDARNQDVFRHPYRCYLSPGVEPTTTDQGFVVSHYAGNKHVLYPNSSLTLTDISDGTAQTILGGEIFAEFLPYAQPGNWRDPADGLQTVPQSFGRPTGDGAFLLMADGAVHWLSKEIDPDIFRALGTPTGGEKVPTGTLPTVLKR